MGGTVDFFSFSFWLMHSVGGGNLQVYILQNVNYDYS